MKDVNSEVDFPEVEEDTSMEDVYDLSGQPILKSPPGVPHCDCARANELAGANTSAARDRSTGLRMQLVVATEHGTCPHCGCHVFLRPIEKANKNYGAIHGVRGVKTNHKASPISKWHAEDGLKAAKKLKLVSETPISKAVGLISGSVK